MFISIEGGEGSGKTTLTSKLAEYLRSLGFVVTQTREPGGTSLGEKIRSLVLDPAEDPAAHTELLLMSASRAQLVDRVVTPAIARHEIVVCDRFSDATYAYQGAGRGVASDQIDAAVNVATDGVQPDVTLLLDAPVEIAAARRYKRDFAADLGADRIEQEAMDFHERVRARYLERAKAYPERMHVLDANRPEAAVLDDAIDIIEDVIAEHAIHADTLRQSAAR